MTMGYGGINENLIPDESIDIRRVEHIINHVAVLVAFFWNYHLQRIFVYRNHDFRKFIRQYFRD